MWKVDKILSKLDENATKRLKNIYEPIVVGKPYEDARRSMMVMPDGEIRVYGHYGYKTYGDKDATPCYISSIDGGLTWSFHDAPKGCMGAGLYIPEVDRYVAVKEVLNADRTFSTYAYISNVGPNDINYKIVDTGANAFDVFQPYFINNRRRLISVGHCYYKEKDEHHPIFMYSDDYGDSWKYVELKSSIRFTERYPNEVPRWENNGGESIVAEMPDGRLMLIARTSLDNFYVYYSSDMGETWTDGEDSYFNGTLTTPFFLQLKDKRTMFFFNNTQKLPLEKECIMAKGSSHRHVFTNRDANHVAITSDFINWTGFREMHLNPIRNRSDYRTYGNTYQSRDKSVHQFQAIELPFNKVLVCMGQSETCVLKIFDIDWLYEKTRYEDFSKGLENLSTHLYVKSYSGSMGILGHCQWNRVNGALLVPTPELDGREALSICHTSDPRLYSNKQGVVWNFPNAKKGSIELELYRLTKGVSVSLLNRWFNPCDERVSEHAVFNFKLTEKELNEKEWETIKIDFDLNNKKAVISKNGKVLFESELLNEVYHGISYIHIQTDCDKGDYEGVLLKSIDFKGE